MTDQAAAASAVPIGRLLVRAVLRTDVGLVRSENQDFGTLTTTAEEKRSGMGGRLLIVADGMGGHRGGATASRLAGETVKTQFLQSKTKDIPTALRDSLSRANARIFSEAQTNPDLRGMGTTTSALAIHGNQGWFAHVGDSRIYMVRDGAIKQLTDDHSLVATMVREGLLTTKEAETHPRRNVLQRSMGVAEEVEIDVRGPIEVREGDTFILCSDGLHGLVKEEELLEVAGRPLNEAADQFVKLALERGAPDNVTVIVARVEKQGEGEDTLVDEEPLDTAMFDETVREPSPATEESPFEMAATTLPQNAPVPALDVRPEPPPASQTPVATPTPAPVTPAPTAPTAPPAASTPKAPESAESTLKIKTQPGSTAVSSGSEDATLRVAPPKAADKSAPAEKEDDTLKVKRGAAAAAAPQRGSSVLKWMLIAVIVLGAAGAWLYMNSRTQESRNAPPSQTTPSR